MGATMNGYPRIDAADGRLARVSVAGRPTYLLAGPVAAVLTEVGRRFHAEVEPVVTFNGWRSAALNEASGGIPTSNHLSGTAVDINGGRHPRYQHGTFSPAQVTAIRRILADLGGVVRWGGDWGSQVDEMHFEVVGSLANVAAVSNTISGVGTVPDVPDLTDPDPIAEDDMFSDADRALLQNVEDLLARGSTSGAGIRGDVEVAADKVDAARADVNTVANELRAGFILLGQQVAADDDTVDTAAFAAAVAAAIPDGIVRGVADELAKRLKS